jgi:hypothetical protein
VEAVPLTPGNTHKETEGVVNESFIFVTELMNYRYVRIVSLSKKSVEFAHSFEQSYLSLGYLTNVKTSISVFLNLCETAAR